MNGQLASTGEYEDDWFGSNTQDFSATLVLGKNTLDSNWAAGTMWMDELLIFEEELPCDDILKLYHGYQ